MKFLVFLFISLSSICFAQTTDKKGRDISVSPFIDGTLLVPESQENPPLVIIIAGSGPTNRDGNQQMMGNNSLKFLAEGLFDEGIASFRYDKRILKQMKEKTLNEESIRFDDFIKDARDVFTFFKKANAFSKIYIIGHSQGSLVGMIAAHENADGFISLAGVGKEIDKVIIDQLAKQNPALEENAKAAFEAMRREGIATEYNPLLGSIFRPQIQPFLISWMRYNPQIEIAKLTIPVMIINGDKDIQVNVSEAELLHTAKPDATYLIIPTMNHILKSIEGNDLENSKSYNDSLLPIMPALIEAISQFVLQ